MGLVCPQLRLCLPSLELKPCQLLLRTKFGKKTLEKNFGQTLGLVSHQLGLCLFTRNLELHKLRLRLSSLDLKKLWKLQMHIFGLKYFCQLHLCWSWLNLRFTNVLVVGLDYIMEFDWIGRNSRWEFKRIWLIPDVYLNICFVAQVFWLHTHVISGGCWYDLQNSVKYHQLSIWNLFCCKFVCCLWQYFYYNFLFSEGLNETFLALAKNNWDCLSVFCKMGSTKKAVVRP